MEDIYIRIKDPETGRIGGIDKGDLDEVLSLGGEIVGDYKILDKESGKRGIVDGKDLSEVLKLGGEFLGYYEEPERNTEGYAKSIAGDFVSGVGEGLSGLGSAALNMFAEPVAGAFDYIGEATGSGFFKDRAEQTRENIRTGPETIRKAFSDLGDSIKGEAGREISKEDPYYLSSAAKNLGAITATIWPTAKIAQVGSAAGKFIVSNASSTLGKLSGRGLEKISNFFSYVPKTTGEVAGFAGAVVGGTVGTESFREYISPVEERHGVTENALGVFGDILFGLIGAGGALTAGNVTGSVARAFGLETSAEISDLVKLFLNSSKIQGKTINSVGNELRNPENFLDSLGKDVKEAKTWFSSVLLAPNPKINPEVLAESAKTGVKPTLAEAVSGGNISGKWTNLVEYFVAGNKATDLVYEKTAESAANEQIKSFVESSFRKKGSNVTPELGSSGEIGLNASEKYISSLSARRKEVKALTESMWEAVERKAGEGFTDVAPYIKWVESTLNNKLGGFLPPGSDAEKTAKYLSATLSGLMSHVKKYGTIKNGKPLSVKPENVKFLDGKAFLTNESTPVSGSIAEAMVPTKIFLMDWRNVKNSGYNKELGSFNYITESQSALLAELAPKSVGTEKGFTDSIIKFNKFYEVVGADLIKGETAKGLLFPDSMAGKTLTAFDYTGDLKNLSILKKLLGKQENKFGEIKPQKKLTPDEGKLSAKNALLIDELKIARLTKMAEDCIDPDRVLDVKKFDKTFFAPGEEKYVTELLGGKAEYEKFRKEFGIIKKRVDRMGGLKVKVDSADSPSYSPNLFKKIIEVLLPRSVKEAYESPEVLKKTIERVSPAAERQTGLKRRAVSVPVQSGYGKEDDTNRPAK